MADPTLAYAAQAEMLEQRLSELQAIEKTRTDRFEALAPFKVDNAIILAAGLSSRFAPISYEKPVRTRCRPKIKLTTTTACRLLLNHWAISPVYPSHSKFCSKTCCAGRMVTRLPKRISTRWQDG